MKVSKLKEKQLLNLGGKKSAASISLKLIRKNARWHGYYCEALCSKLPNINIAELFKAFKAG